MFLKSLASFFKEFGLNRMSANMLPVVLLLYRSFIAYKCGICCLGFFNVNLHLISCGVFNQLISSFSNVQWVLDSFSVFSFFLLLVMLSSRSCFSREADCQVFSLLIYLDCNSELVLLSILKFRSDFFNRKSRLSRLTSD